MNIEEAAIGMIEIENTLEIEDVKIEIITEIVIGNQEDLLKEEIGIEIVPRIEENFVKDAFPITTEARIEEKVVIRVGIATIAEKIGEMIEDSEERESVEENFREDGKMIEEEMVDVEMIDAEVIDVVGSVENVLKIVRQEENFLAVKITKMHQEVNIAKKSNWNSAKRMNTWRRNCA